MEYETYSELLEVADDLADALSEVLAHVSHHELPRPAVNQADSALEAYQRWCERRLEEDQDARRRMADDRHRGHRP